MSKRTDIHSPANFDPAAYSYEATFYQGPDATSWDSDPGVWALIRSSSFKGNYDARGTCDHCGAHFHYGAVYIHEEGDIIVVGDTCARNAFGEDSRRAYDLRRAKDWAKLARERTRRDTRVNAFLDARPELREAIEKGQHHIIRDIGARLWKWGEISEKQESLVLKLWDEEQNPAPVTCEHCAADGHKVDDCPARTSIPEGKADRKVKVLAVKLRDGYYGTQLKMLGRDVETGAKVWCTYPANAPDEGKGKVIVLRGTYSTSEDDPLFGFVSRPSCRGVVEGA